MPKYRLYLSSNKAMSKLETVVIETSHPIKQSVIWLHGLGADGHDFAPIVPELDMPNTRFVFRMRRTSQSP